MKVQLFFIRKIKGIFLKLKLHVIFGWTNGFMKNLFYLNEFSKWRSKHSKVPFNDFYTLKFGSTKRFDIYDNIHETELKKDKNINYLEFGVAYGKTFRWWTENIKHPEARFFGFDTFEGLPEDWHLYKKGDMSPDGKYPVIEGNRHEFITGLFQETLYKFLDRFEDNKRKVIHLDADLYTSTLFVLTSLAKYLKPGDIIIFDEFGVPTHEFKAWTEFVKSFYIEYEVLGAVNNYFQLSLKITKTPF
jgi:hypothetical protein